MSERSSAPSGRQAVASARVPREDLVRIDVACALRRMSRSEYIARAAARAAERDLARARGGDPS